VYEAPQLECREQRRGGGRGTGELPDDVVDGARRRSDDREEFPLPLVEVRRVGVARSRRRPPGEVRERLQDVGGGADQARPLPDEAVWPGAQRRGDRAGDGEDLAVLLEGHVCGHQRAAALGRLDNDHAPGQPADDAVAQWEVPGFGLGAEGKLGDERAARGDFVGEAGMLRRVEPVEAGAEHGERSPAARQSAAVRAAIDAPGKAETTASPAAARSRASLPATVRP